MKRITFYLLIIALIAGIVWLFAGGGDKDEPTSPPQNKGDQSPEGTKTPEDESAIISLDDLYKKNKAK